MPKKAPKPAPPRRPRGTPLALTLAEHGEAPVRLTTPERSLLNEALRRGEDLREQVETSVTSYGRWLLGAVFANDAAAALDDKSKNPVWLELVRRAGGPSLRIGRRMLYVAVQVAAHDKRITDQAWRGLDAGRKELLLPLVSEDRLREGAQHVSKFNLSQANTRHYVTEVLKSEGKARGVRLTAPRLLSRVQKLRTALGGAAAMKRIVELRGELGASDRDKVLAEMERLRGVLGEVMRVLKGKR